MRKGGIWFFSHCLIPNGSVTKLTWPLVNGIKNPRYTFYSYWWSNDILKVSYWSLKNRSYNAITSFFGGRVTWPDLRWPGTKFSGKVRKGWLISMQKTAARSAAVFSLLLENRKGVLNTPPPIRARVKRMKIFYVHNLTIFQVKSSPKQIIYNCHWQ